MSVGSGVINWKEFLIPDSKRSVSCSTGNNVCLMRLDGPFSNYTILVKDRKAQLLNNINGKLHELSPLTSDGRRYGLKSKNSEQFVNFDLDVADSKVAITLLENGGYYPQTHRFNFYPEEGAVTMNKEHMPSLLKLPRKLRLGKSHGYGVFAIEDIKAGEVVEETPMLAQADPYLINYTFGFNKQHLLALGLGSLYNHADKPNIGHSISPQGNIITFTALRDITEGEQCTISYGPAYFSSRGLTPEPI